MFYLFKSVIIMKLNLCHLFLYKIHKYTIFVYHIYHCAHGKVYNSLSIIDLQRAQPTRKTWIVLSAIWFDNFEKQFIDKTCKVWTQSLIVRNLQQVRVLRFNLEKVGLFFLVNKAITQKFRYYFMPSFWFSLWSLWRELSSSLAFRPSSRTYQSKSRRNCLTD